ncbi:MFS transporter [Bacillus pseudomycoides]|uniref:MFS transporter n=1 Tax=Bacillus pseudomycoides TaxID=64104 RepID=UPI002E1A98D9|nr:MFS transporter [Bacillus pseudomycoides]
MKRLYKGLWKHRDYRNLWVGQTISMFGTQIALIALPLVAAITLGASPLQMGILQAIEYLPVLLISLVAGVWIDRRPIRPILITTDIVRAILLLAIPISMYFGVLNLEILYVVAFLVGINTVLSDIGQMSYLPVIVKKEDLIEGNSKLEFSYSTASIVGQGLGGVLIQIFTAPFAILIQSLALLFSSLFLFRIKKKEEVQKVENEESNMMEMIKEGISYVIKNKIIRNLVITTMIFNFFTILIEPIYLLFVSRGLKLAPVFIGMIFGMAGAGALLGALLVGPMTRKLGLGRCMVVALFLAGLSSLLIPVATFLPTIPAVILLMVMQLIDAIMIVVYNINQRSLRTSITPDNLLGRMNSSIRLCVMGIVPVAALAGGFIAGIIGVLPTLIIGSVGIIFSSVFVAFTSIHELEEIPKSDLGEEVNV